MTVEKPPGSTPRIVGDVVFQRVSDGAILLSTAEEVYFGLNAVGAEIWERLEEEKDLAEICGDLQDHYPDVDAERVRSDVEDLLRNLSREGLVSWPEIEAAGNGEDG